MEVLDISETQIRLKNQIRYKCFNSTAETSPTTSSSTTFYLMTQRAPYTVSGTANKLFAVGCRDIPHFTGSTNAAFFSLSNDGTASCRTNCSSGGKNVVAGECNGIGCCQAAIPKGMRSYSVSLDYESNHSTLVSYNPCGYSFVADQESFKFRGIPDLDDPNVINRTMYDAPLVLDWVIANNTCANAPRDRDSYACKENTTCVDAVDSGIGGYRCSCLPGYEGHPYLSPGCSDINECEDLDSSPCSMICTNTQGNYTCSCPSGYIGDGTRHGTGCQAQYALKVGLGVGLGSLTILITGSWVFLASRNRRLTQMKETFFQRNGGSLLKQLIAPSKQDDDVEQVKVFTIDELKVATKNFKDERIVGRGGYGTVYKGFLPNNQIVAVKRSKFVDENQIEQFINELILLARLRHPNVVRLIGCCLEVEVPLLVYEFISNGTVYDHIHNKNGASWYSWSNCLRISMESANALAYIHTIPIFHRDIKSANILLDDSFTAKVSDFGASRLIPLHETHLSTVVQGTLGYLDPEYFFSSQLTAKSDVYSFGVVLCELLTRTKPLLTERQSEESNQNLATYFVKSMQQDNLFKILDSQLVMEATKEQLISISKLVERCLSVEGNERPTMKEVAMELGDLWKQTTYLSPNKSRH
ncbi:wall-associated receptor kinase 5-like [Spinacia oleracea]|uniref:Wall-associated receptor kinase 5-like n=1 Tax=Spinacia oleracea TaxID=3562 RepID=A0A9R0JWF7_SPIOL|nr:wall-associated receptor kinase 5-like [Spinacia oleracea]